MNIASETPDLSLAIIVPIVGALATFLVPRFAMRLGIVTTVVNFFGVLLLIGSLHRSGVHSTAVGGWEAPLHIQLAADGVTAVFLAITATVYILASIYASGYFDRHQQTRFWPVWLLLLSALNALFLSHDIFNLYVTLELMGLSAASLVAFPGTARALQSSMRYLLAALCGSMFYLLGVAFLYQTNGTLDLNLLSQSIEFQATDWIGFALITTGLALKTAIFPLHFWLPPAHSSAPSPVSAILSALVVKATLYILLRLWLDLFSQSGAVVGQVLGLLGAGAIIWGSLLALQQSRVKLLIAYSTVAQLGYLLLGFALAGKVAWQGVVWLAVSHALAKAAMFLAAGNIQSFSGHDRLARLDNIAQRLPLSVAAFALSGICLMGLPPSAGFIGKWLLLQAAFEQNQWWIIIVTLLGGLLTAAYVFKVLGKAFTPAAIPTNPHSIRKRRQWAALALATIPILLGFYVEPTLELLDIGETLNGGGSQ